MKRLLIICLAFIVSMGASESFAQKKTELFKATFDATIHCQECVKRIESNQAVLGTGVKDVEIKMKEQQLVIVYDSKKTSKEAIVKNLKKIDISAKFKSQVAYVEPAKSKAQKK